MSIDNLKPLENPIGQLNANELNHKLVLFLANNQSYLDTLYNKNINEFNKLKSEISEDFFLKFKNDFEQFILNKNSSGLARFLTMVDLGKEQKIYLNDSTLIIFEETNVKIEQYKKNFKKTASSTDGGCYIATMAYGDYDHPQVMELRRFRDDFLNKTIIGRSFIKLYYKYSPRLVEILKNKRSINFIIRKGLDQFIKAIRK